MRILNCGKGLLVRATAVLAAVALHGCASSSGPEAPAAMNSRAPLASATTPDGFPNINIVPRAETAQLSVEEKAQLFADLKAARARQAAGDGTAATAAEIARLRQIARRHGIDALAEIEGG